MNVVSLFDGCGMAYVALKKLGIKVNKYYASEIDEPAIKVARHNHPDITHLGDVKSIDFTEFTDIDLLIGGSPCTDLSISKTNREGLKGERSGLFYEYVRALKEIKPKYFVLENVASMANSERDKITEALGVDCIMINSALLSAQQRKRYYWTNIPDIKQPEDKHIYLKDILESGDSDRLKSYCIDANYYKGASLEQYLTKSRRQLVFDSPDRIGSINKGGQGDRIYSVNGKSVSLSANGGERGAKIGLYCVAMRGRYDENGKVQQKLEPRFDGKTNTLTTVQKDNMVLDLKDGDYVVRKLTPLETERLQTLPDGYTFIGTYFTKSGKEKLIVSDSQRYKMIGNGFTVDVIAHILSHMPEYKESL